MARFLKKNKSTVGSAPGSLNFVGNQKMKKPKADIYSWTGTDLNINENVKAKNVSQFLTPEYTNWVNVYGIHDAPTISTYKEMFNIHPLVAEDIMDTNQRPKLEQFEDLIFVSIKIPFLNEEKKEVDYEQSSFILKNNALLSFQEMPRGFFGSVRTRIQNGIGQIRLHKHDYLLFALLDTIIDQYSVILDFFGSAIDEVEQQILSDELEDIKELLHKIKLFRRELNMMLKFIKPIKDVCAQLLRAEHNLLSKEIKPFLSDLFDITSQVEDGIDNYRTTLFDCLNLHQTMVSNKMNDVMKVLTIFSALFIPLSFIAGVYGTNFEHVPEFQLQNGYFYFWGLILLTAGGLMFYFYKKKWL